MRPVSIIIPVKAINKFIRESYAYIQELDYPDFEVLILPDEDTKESFPRARIIATDSIGPAEKRDLAATYAKGEILAFLDDDAYPSREWLKNALIHFDNPLIAAVGGPAVTPPCDDIRQQASGEAYASWLVSWRYTYRYRPARRHEVDDYPSVNLLVRKDIFNLVGGFNTGYYPGEDTKLCLDIIARGYKIMYDPAVLVYHHRRPVFKEHLKQVANYGLHRGNFARILPATSCRPAYFVPSFFVIFAAFASILGHFFQWLYQIYWLTAILYFLLVTLSVMRIKNIRLRLITAAAIVATHFTYGIFFIKGLLTKKLTR